jgi:Domain of unknown function (DUF4062)
VEPQRGRSGNEGLPREEVIRTPDRRLRVFVSSTLGELADERQAVSRAISALRLTPVMFELGARPHPPQELPHTAADVYLLDVTEAVLIEWDLDRGQMTSTRWSPRRGLQQHTRSYP